MTIHKEGYKSIAIAVIMFGVINMLSFYLISYAVQYYAGLYSWPPWAY